MSISKREGFRFYTYDFSEGFKFTINKIDLCLGEEVQGSVRIISESEIDIEKVWINLRCEERLEKDWAILYNNDVMIIDAIRVTAGFDQEYPFSIKLPSVGRETYHSIHQDVQWMVDAYMKVKGIKQTVRSDSGREIYIKKPSAHTIQVKEIVREVVLIPCSYCGGLMPQTSIFCPNCGARRKS